MRIIVAFLTVIFLAACSFESYNQREIVGQWFSESWTSGGEETGYRAWMAFDEDSTYRALFNNRREQGTYWIDGHRLYTHAKDAQPIKVKISSLEEQSMVIEMNRGGITEEITFGRGTVKTIEGSEDQ